MPEQVGVPVQNVQGPPTDLPPVPTEIQTQMARQGKLVQVAQALLVAYVQSNGLKETPKVDPVNRAFFLANDFINAADGVLSEVQKQYTDFIDGLHEEENKSQDQENTDE